METTYVHTGFPSHCPETHPYFSDPKRETDLYAISISLVPKKPILGDDLVFGNDFDRPIRDRLPPGSNYALRIVNWWVDPGLSGDVYADKPYLYGPALSSWNYFSIGDKEEEEGEEKEKDAAQKDVVVEEGGGVSSGLLKRRTLGIPDETAERKRFFLDAQNQARFQFEPGRLYRADFGNSYLGFGDFSVKLPGWSVMVTDYVDEAHHELRYVLKIKDTDDLLFATRLVLVPKNHHANQEWDGEEEEEKNEAQTEGETDKPSKIDGKGPGGSQEEEVD